MGLLNCEPRLTRRSGVLLSVNSQLPRMLGADWSSARASVGKNRRAAIVKRMASVRQQAGQRRPSLLDQALKSGTMSAKGAGRDAR